MFIRLYGLSLYSLLWSTVVAKVITSTNCRLYFIPVGAVKEMYQIRLWIVWQFWTLLSGTRDPFFSLITLYQHNSSRLTVCMADSYFIRNWAVKKGGYCDTRNGGLIEGQAK